MPQGGLDPIIPPDYNNPDVPEIKSDFYYGADLSYVNEMIDCGAVYRNSENIVKDPYTIFSDAGANLIRVRLWHNPDWTAYSDYQDVLKTIRRAKENGMQVLLDFHYSDTWTDPAKQQIPAAWETFMNDKEKLGSLLFEYLPPPHQQKVLPKLLRMHNLYLSFFLHQLPHRKFSFSWSDY